MTTSRIRIAFIGGGNIARSLIAGLVADGHEPNALYVVEPDEVKRAQLIAQFGIIALETTADAVTSAEVVALCVKPLIAPVICREFAPALLATNAQPLFISVMAGVTEASLDRWIGRPVALVRAMPNTPSMIQSGAIGLHANSLVNHHQRNLAEEILRAGGLTRWVENEVDIDTVTALSGSGPAYFLLLMEALEQVGIAHGLAPETARLLTIQTALGAARMAFESDESPQQLRARVTSPGGTTERAIGVFEAGGLMLLVSEAVTAARVRAAELSQVLAEVD